LDQNPNEGKEEPDFFEFTRLTKSGCLVLTLLFTNPEGQNVGDVWDPIFKSAGLDQQTFVPATSPDPIKQSDWPTLGEMIDSGKRVVVFMDASV